MTLEYLGPEDQFLLKVTCRLVGLSSASYSPFTPGYAISDSEQNESLVDSMKEQFQNVNNLSEPEDIEEVNEGLRAYVLILLANPS